MEIFVDKTGQQLLISPENLAKLDAIRLGELAVVTLKVWLLDRGEDADGPLTAGTLPEGTTALIFAGRKADDFTDGALLFSATDFAEVGTGATLHYEAELNLNTATMIAALVGRGTRQCVVDLVAQSGDATVREPLIARWPAVALRAVYAGTEPAPESGDPVYPVPGDLALRTVAGGYRIKEDGSFQLWNPTQNLFHTLSLSGEDGAEILTIAAGEA